jgi:arsenate reductase (glutaredoxin)
MSEIMFYWKSTCTSCRNARKFLLDLGISMTERDLAKNPFTRDELATLLANYDVQDFVNPRSIPYKELQLAGKTLSREQILDLLTAHVNLFKRPFIIKGATVIFGFSPAAYQQLAAK